MNTSQKIIEYKWYTRTHQIFAEFICLQIKLDRLMIPAVPSPFECPENFCRSVTAAEHGSEAEAGALLGVVIYVSHRAVCLRIAYKYTSVTGHARTAVTSRGLVWTMDTSDYLALAAQWLAKESHSCANRSSSLKSAKRSHHTTHHTATETLRALPIEAYTPQSRRMKSITARQHQKNSCAVSS